MPSKKGIIFDPNCGIPVEEQRKILAKINSITEKRRLALTGSEKKKFNAKKSGGLFPIMVNAAAIILLAGGFTAMYIMQGKTDIQVREGTKVYNSAERALIDEIRKETSSRLEDKESEILEIISKLDGIDAELKELYSNNQELNAEQRAAEEQLKTLQDEYRATLNNLQNEQSLILLDMLAKEQEYTGTIEAQMGAFLANVNIAVNENRFDDASEVLQVARDFLNTPAFQGLRSIQERKELYAQTITSFETMLGALDIGETPLAETPAPGDNNAEQLLQTLQEKNTQLEKDIAEKDKTLAAFTSEGSGMAQQLADLQGSVSALREENTEKDSRINTMTTTISGHEATINKQKADISNREECISKIQGIIQGKAISDMTISELNESLTRIQAALQGLTP